MASVKRSGLLAKTHAWLDFAVHEVVNFRSVKGGARRRRAACRWCTRHITHLTVYIYMTDGGKAPRRGSRSVTARGMHRVIPGSQHPRRDHRQAIEHRLVCRLDEIVRMTTDVLQLETAAHCCVRKDLH